MDEKNINDLDESPAERPLIVRILAILGAIAVPVIAYLLFRYGYLLKI